MKILHKKGKDKITVDALSWKDEESLSLVVLIVVPEWLNEIQIEYEKNLETCAIINNLVQDSKYEWKMTSFGIKEQFT